MVAMLQTTSPWTRRAPQWRSRPRSQPLGKTMSAMEQFCTAFDLAGSLIVLSSSKTVDGAWVFNGFAERVAVGAAADDIGSAVSRGLAASAVGVPPPPRLGGVRA